MSGASLDILTQVLGINIFSLREETDWLLVAPP
jgi:hypothetical protein